MSVTVSKPRLAIDMDEVIADANQMHAAWLSQEHGYSWSQHEVQGTSLKTLASEEHNAQWEARLHEGSVFGSFDVMPNSQEALQSLSERFEIFITTAAMEFPASCGPKYQWLQEHFPFISPMNIVFCGDKSIIAADILVDDNVRHFTRFRGQGVLFSAPHNLDVDWPLRVLNWDDAVEKLMIWGASR